MELMHVVMAKLEAWRGLEAVVPLRQDSKARHAAFKVYSGATMCSVEQCSDFLRLSKSMPCMGSLTANLGNKNSGYHYHRGLAQSLQLTSVQSVGLHRQFSEEQKQLVQLSRLPASLQVIEIESLFMDPQCFKNMLCTGLTKLILKQPETIEEEFKWLQQTLPNLKVISHDYYCGK